jgi:ferrous iron transport protein A
MLLSELARGSAARVLRVAPVGPSTGDQAARGIATRLMELGLLPGTQVHVVRIAPMGDPMVVSVRGAELSVRHSEARLVTVEPIERGA